MMKRSLFTGIATAAFVVTSAAAFAASPAPTAPTASPTAAATDTAQPAAKPARLAQQTKLKNCEKQWSAGEKGGKLNDMTRKAFLSSCVKGA